MTSASKVSLTLLLLMTGLNNNSLSLPFSEPTTGKDGKLFSDSFLLFLLSFSDDFELVEMRERDTRLMFPKLPRVDALFTT